MSSELQDKQRKMAFAKKQIKGGISCLTNAAKQLGSKDGQHNELLKTIFKLEATMLNQLAEHYEATRAEILWERQTGRELATNKK